MATLGRVMGKALKHVHSGEEKLATRRLMADRLPRITVTSDSFADGGKIPVRHTADGDDVSPPLRFASVPGGTKELVLICEDPDAPTPMPFVHWIVFGMPATTAELRQAVDAKTPLMGGKQGKTTMRHESYDGPAPPPGHGPHHYHFQVFALDTTLDLEAGAGRTELLEAMEGHVIAAGELVGVYER